MTTSGVLSDRERASLAAVCEAFHPALNAEAGDDAAVFGLSAAGVGVPAAAAEAIALLPAVEQGQMRQLLRLLDGPIPGLLYPGTTSALNEMSAGQRERVLRGLATSRIPQLRSGFQAVKRLSSFLLYSIPGADGSNAAWSSLGYARPDSSPARITRLAITRPSAATTFDCDVCIVGSGAGGGVAAAELASRGLRVVILEAGPGDQGADFEQQELAGTQRLFLGHGLAATRDLSVSLLAGACLGGGTTVNWQTSLRTPDFIRDEWRDRSGCELFTSAQYSRALDTVCARIGVSTAESAVNPNNAVLQRGGGALGHDCSSITRNSRGCDSAQCGFCMFGCRIGGKQSTTVTYLDDSMKTGNTTIIASCRATRVMIARGKATGVEATYVNGDGTRIPIMVRAASVVVCAGGLQSPALLQRSGITLSHVGRNLYLHPTSAVAGLYAERIEGWSGPPQTILDNAMARADGNYGVRLEAAPTHPGFFASAAPWTSAREHRRLIQQTAHAGVIIALTRDAAGGRVRSRRDGSVMVDYRPAAAERRLIARGIAEAVRVHMAAGAVAVHTLHTRGLSMRRDASTSAAAIAEFCSRVLRERVSDNWAGLFSAHQMGTCRMGRDARTAVCDERGEVFGVRGLYVADASAFPASSGVNPMITVMALAQCVAEGI